METKLESDTERAIKQQLWAAMARGRGGEGEQVEHGGGQVKYGVRDKLL